MTASDPRPSEEQMWAGPSGERWLANAAKFEASLVPIGNALLDAAALTPGLRVLDVGCGAGALALEVASRVAPGGAVTALDISPPLIAEARRKAAAHPPKADLHFALEDAAHTHLPPASFDLLLSRFGIMFFSDPYAAFAHLHTRLLPTGRLALACWAAPTENPWMLDVRNIMAAYFDMPMPPPRAPGPFAFADPDYLREILSKAGFQHITIAPWKSHMFVAGPGTNPQAAAEFLLTAIGIAQRATDAPPAVQTEIREKLVAHLLPFDTDQGVSMPASAWIVTARA